MQNIKNSSFKNNGNIQKKEGGPDRSVSNNNWLFNSVLENMGFYLHSSSFCRKPTKDSESNEQYECK